MHTKIDVDIFKEKYDRLRTTIAERGKTISREEAYCANTLYSTRGEAHWNRCTSVSNNSSKLTVLILMENLSTVHSYEYS